MAQIEPFRGLRYTHAAGSLASLVAPPYDVISPADRTSLVAGSTRNIVRVDLPEGGDDARYDSSGDLWRSWLADGTIVPDEHESLYLIEETFTTPTGEPGRRVGFAAALTLEGFGKDGVRPHERTYEGPKADRLRLMRATHANISQIFALYRDPARRLDAAFESLMSSGEPEATVAAPDGTRKLWVVSDAVIVSLAREVLDASDLTIADGHHRYETALTFHEECVREDKAPGSDRVLVYLSNMDDPDLTILPAHRAVKLPTGLSVEDAVARLEPWFDVERLPADSASARLASELAHGTGEPYRFGLCTAGSGWMLLTLRSWAGVSDTIDHERSEAWRALDVAVLHDAVLAGMLGITQEIVAETRCIRYTVRPEEGCAMLEDGRADLLFMVRPTTSAQVAAVADAGDTMPQKSTYFYPKLLTGLVMRSLE